MGTFLVLGSSFAVPDEHHENTHLVLLGAHGLIMVDCAGQPVLRLRKAGLDFHKVTDLILTHFHPDHVYGVPMLLMEMWLRGRQEPLRIYGLQHTVERMALVMNAFEWQDWPRMFPVTFHPVEQSAGAFVLENADFHITAMPVRHFLPTMGMRVTDKTNGRVLAYSCDTEPCPEVVQLAANADLLLHEATGSGLGHASAAQAGDLGRQAGAKKLVLIHYRTGSGANLPTLVPEAEKAFGGPVALAEDFMQFEW